MSFIGKGEGRGRVKISSNRMMNNEVSVMGFQICVCVCGGKNGMAGEVVGAVEEGGKQFPKAQCQKRRRKCLHMS